MDPCVIVNVVTGSELSLIQVDATAATLNRGIAELTQNGVNTVPTVIILMIVIIVFFF